jgi:hypothetical protein
MAERKSPEIATRFAIRDIEGRFHTESIKPARA